MTSEDLDKTASLIDTMQGAVTYITSDMLSTLPTTGIDIGTAVYCVDTGAVYMFNPKTSTWVEQ